MTDKMTFTKGRAVGGVNFKENDNWTGANPETVTLTLDSTDVELTFDNGNETLTAKFANWYDVTMETKINGSNNSNKLTFTADGKTIDNKFKFRDQDTYVVENFTGEQMILANGTEHKVVDQGTNEGTTGISNGAFDIGYYGDTGTPTEATGFIKYGENLPNGDQDGSRVKELDVTIGFGVTNP